MFWKEFGGSSSMKSDDLQDDGFDLFLREGLGGKDVEVPAGFALATLKLLHEKRIREAAAAKRRALVWMVCAVGGCAVVLGVLSRVVPGFWDFGMADVWGGVEVLKEWLCVGGFVGVGLYLSYVLMDYLVTD